MRLVLTLLLIIVGLEARDLRHDAVTGSHPSARILKAAVDAEAAPWPEACVMRIEIEAEDDTPPGHDV